MPYKDLREWLSKLEEAGELQRVKKEVDWDQEVGAISRRVYDLKAPAPLFEKIKGYPKGYRILGAPIGLSARNKYARLALALDMPINSTIKELVEEFIQRKRNPILPVLVKSGPCQENIHTGDDIDLLEFPVPMIHEGDGGRYIGTWHSTITKDRDSDWVNYGMYRHMVHDKSHFGCLTVEAVEHIGLHYKRYSTRGERMEAAVALGTEPVTALVSASGIEEGVSEPDIIGALRGEPLELVKCKTVDLYVPATSEIVLEGYVDPTQERKDEGPFGEYTGYMASPVLPQPVFNVTAITHRNDPILPMSCMGVPVDDAAVILPLSMSAQMLEHLRDIKRFPVNFVYFPEEGVSHFGVISTKVPYKDYPRNLAMNVWALKHGRQFSNVLMVVNDDVDITDIKQVIWALATRVNPERGVWILPHTHANPLLPWLTPEESTKREGSRMLIDATWPADWPKEWIRQVSSFETIWSKEVQERVLKNWKEYGYPETLFGEI